MFRRNHSLPAVITALSLSSWVSAVQAQSAGPQPHCSVVDSVRLAQGPFLSTGNNENLVVTPLASPGPAGERYVVAVRDLARTLGTGGVADFRDVSELQYTADLDPPALPGGLVVMRMDASMHRVGDPVLVPDESESHLNDSTLGGMPVAITLAQGVLIVERVNGELWSVLVPASGAIAAPVKLTGVAPENIAWLTGTARNSGGIVIAGTDRGTIMTLRFDPSGALIDKPVTWATKPDGWLELLPTAADGTGPLVGLFIRKTGTLSDGRPAYRRVVLPLTDGGLPASDPDSPTLATTPVPGVPVSYVRDGSRVRLAMWDWPRGSVRMDISLSNREPGLSPLDARNSSAPLQGAYIGHDAVMGPGGSFLSLVVGSNPFGAGVHAELLYEMPDGTAFIRHDVIPARARVMMPPRLLPAADGVVVVMASQDETGAGIDAYHLRCDVR